MVVRALPPRSLIMPPGLEEAAAGLASPPPVSVSSVTEGGYGRAPREPYAAGGGGGSSVRLRRSGGFEPVSSVRPHERNRSPYFIHTS
jgi:hypothetical protein